MNRARSGTPFHANAQTFGGVYKLIISGNYDGGFPAQTLQLPILAQIILDEALFLRVVVFCISLSWLAVEVTTSLRRSVSNASHVSAVMATGDHLNESGA